jgi:hypothetical protein
LRVAGAQHEPSALVTAGAQHAPAAAGGAATGEQHAPGIEASAFSPSKYGIAASV